MDAAAGELGGQAPREPGDLVERYCLLGRADLPPFSDPQPHEGERLGGAVAQGAETAGVADVPARLHRVSDEPDQAVGCPVLLLLGLQRSLEALQLCQSAERDGG